MKEIQSTNIRSKRPNRLEVKKASIVTKYENLLTIANMIIAALVTYILFDAGIFICDNLVQIIIVTLFVVISITYVLDSICDFLERRF